MKIEKMNRQQGKTTKIVGIVKKDKNGILIVPTLFVKNLVSRNHKLNKNKIFTLNEFQKIKGNKNIYIDDIGECLQVLLGRLNVIYGTHTDYWKSNQKPQFASSVNQNFKE